MEFPKELKYQKTDEWVKIEDDVAVIGISDYAQDALSDVVFVEFEVEVGDQVNVGDTYATIESVKAASDVNIPLSGEVIEINEGLADSPEILNSDPYGQGWMIKIKIIDVEEVDNLLDAESYEAYCKER